VPEGKAAGPALRRERSEVSLARTEHSPEPDAAEDVLEGAEGDGRELGEAPSFATHVMLSQVVQFLETDLLQRRRVESQYEGAHRAIKIHCKSSAQLQGGVPGHSMHDDWRAAGPFRENSGDWDMASAKVDATTRRAVRRIVYREARKESEGTRDVAAFAPCCEMRA
jgi:hypothetical protein